MKTLGSRQFQLTYQKLTEPVRVVSLSSGDKTIGFFYPGDVPPVKEKPSEITLEEALGGLSQQDAEYMKRKMGKGRK